MTEYFEKWGRGRPSKEKLEMRKKHHEKINEMIKSGELPMLNHILYGDINSKVEIDSNGNVKMKFIRRH